MQVLAIIFGIILICGLCALIGFQVFNLVRTIKDRNKKRADTDKEVDARKE